MSASLRRYRAIRDALLHLYPAPLSARQTRHLVTLAALISGIVGSRQTPLPASASKRPDRSKRESRVKRFQRWLTNPSVTPERSVLPIAAVLIQRRAHGPLALVMDGSTVGRACLALVVSLVYQGRALPSAWRVVAQGKGHVDVDTHRALRRVVHALVPAETTVIFLGEGECGGPALQAALTRRGWGDVCRTAKNIQIHSAGEWLTLGDGYVAPGHWLGLPDVRMTGQAYGPVLAMVGWGREYREPLYLVTTLDLVADACWWYRTRFRIATFFSDHKSRGFHLHQSHLSDPARLTRLLLAAGVAYLWIIYLGALVQRDDWLSQLHRTARCDLSLFHLGFVLLDHLLNEALPIPVAFRPPDLEAIESVR